MKWYWVFLVMAIIFIFGALWCSFNGAIGAEIMCVMTVILCNMNMRD